MRGSDHGPLSAGAVAMKVTCWLPPTSLWQLPAGVEPSEQLHGGKPPVPVVLGKCRAKYITQLPFGARATEGSCAKTVRVGRQSQGNSQSGPCCAHWARPGTGA